MAIDAGDHGRSFLLLSANTPWVYALGRALAAYGPVTAMRFYDWSNQRRLKPEWPEVVSEVRRVSIAMPPGYAGRLEPIFRALMRSVIERERSQLRRLSGADPITICPYPYLEPWVRRIPANERIYYNLDDYVLYNPSRANRIRALEMAMVAGSRLTLCLSAHQVAKLVGQHPQQAHRIRHFPLGVTSGFLNPFPDSSGVPNSVGYIGNMSDRVDWTFVASVAKRLPQVTFFFVGRVGSEGEGHAWGAARASALALPNMVQVGEVPQAEVHRHYWRYAMNWMPYGPAHPFNIASCPTKIMDGLASGRPFLSTDIPEVNCYPDWIKVATDPDTAVAQIQECLASNRHDARRQVEFAAGNNWAQRARSFVQLLSEESSAGALSRPWSGGHRAFSGLASG